MNMESISNFRGAMRQDSLGSFSFLFSGRKGFVCAGAGACLFVFYSVILGFKKNLKCNFITADHRTAREETTRRITKSL